MGPDLGYFPGPLVRGVRACPYPRRGVPTFSESHESWFECARLRSCERLCVRTEQVRRFEAGEDLMAEGCPAESFFMVEEGSLELTRRRYKVRAWLRARARVCVCVSRGRVLLGCVCARVRVRGCYYSTWHNTT